MKLKIKRAAKDFSPDMLPQTRKAVFFDVLKLHWQKLLLLGLILLLFAIPLILNMMTNDVYLSNYFAALEESGRQNDADAVYAPVYRDLFTYALNIPLLMLFSVGLSGVLRVLRQYAWEENVHIPTDFVRGIRDNAKQLLGVAFLTGLIVLLCRIVLYTSASYASETVSMLSLLPIGLSVFLFLPLGALCLVLIPIYSNPLRGHLKNALYLYSHAPLRVAGSLLASFLPWAVTLLPNFYCGLFGSIAALLLLPLSLLGWKLSSYDLLDRLINTEHYPELVGRGLSHPDKTS